MGSKIRHLLGDLNSYSFFNYFGFTSLSHFTRLFILTGLCFLSNEPEPFHTQPTQLSPLDSNPSVLFDPPLPQYSSLNHEFISNSFPLGSCLVESNPSYFAIALIFG